MMYQQLAWIGLLLHASVAYGDEGPSTSESTPSVVEGGAKLVLRFTEEAGSVELAPGGSDISALNRELERLTADQGSLRSLRNTMLLEPEAGENTNSELAKQLRLQLKELLTEFAKQHDQEKRTAEQKSQAAKLRTTFTLPGEKRHDRGAQESDAIETGLSGGKRDTSPTAKTVDPLGLGQALFRIGDFEGSLKSFRLIDLNQFKSDNRIAVQYLMATCLRKLGNLPEATPLYREVANSKADPIIAECAIWQLSTIRWRQETEAQLELLRKRRQALGPSLSTGKPEAANPASEASAQGTP